MTEPEAVWSKPTMVDRPSMLTGRDCLDTHKVRAILCETLSRSFKKNHRNARRGDSDFAASAGGKSARR